MADQQPRRSGSGDREVRDWSSGLPEEAIVESIGKRLPSGHDAASFRSVCKPWRDAVPFDSFAPLLLLPFGPNSENVTFYSVTSEKVTSLSLPAELRGRVPCGASRGWLALMDAAASVTLLNPFTGARVELPPADARVAASSSTEASKVNGRWVLHPDQRHGIAGAPGRVVELEEMRDVFFREIVLSAPPYPGRECVAVAVLGSSTEVAFCRVGVDTAWTLLDTNLEGSVRSVVRCRGKFLAVDFFGDISICNCGDAGAAAPTATTLPSLSLPEDWDLCNRSYLECDGELHLVGAKLGLIHGTLYFNYSIEVYKCDFLGESPAWTRVNFVGNQTLLVSKHFNENFSGPSISTYKENSVYFSKKLYGDHTHMAHRYEAVDIPTGTSEVVPYLEKTDPPEALCWFRPNIWMQGGF